MLQNILNTEEKIYATNLSGDLVKQKIEALFKEKSLGVKGIFTNDYTFTACDQWVVIAWSMPNLKRKAAYLNGEITKVEKETFVKLKSKPNSILPIFAIASILIGIFITLFTLISSSGENYFSVLGLTFIILGIIYYQVSTLVRNRLRKKVVKYLRLIHP